MEFKTEPPTIARCEPAGSLIRPGHAASAYDEELRAIPTEMRATEREFVIRFDIPGAERNSLKIRWAHRELKVEGRRAPPDECGAALFADRAHGAFHCSLPLPEGAPAPGIHASYIDCVLTVRVPRGDAR